MNTVNWSSDIIETDQAEIEELLEFVRINKTSHKPDEAFSMAVKLDDAVIVNDFSCMKDEDAKHYVNIIYSRLSETTHPTLLVAKSAIASPLLSNIDKEIHSALLIEPTNQQCLTVMANYDLSTTPALNVGKSASEKQSNTRRAERWSEKLESLPRDVQLLLLSSLLSGAKSKNN